MFKRSRQHDRRGLNLESIIGFAIPPGRPLWLAMQTRAMLYAQRWQKVIDAADSLDALNLYSLVSDYKKLNPDLSIKWNQMKTEYNIK